MKHQKLLRLFGTLVAVALLHVSGAFAEQNPPTQAAGSTSQSQSPKPVAVPIKITAGDLLEISVFDAPELNQQVRVGADGKVQLALIGSTAVGGMTGQEAAEKIAND